MCFFFFFFCSSRRRHTRCALVTGVQTCALPIFVVAAGEVAAARPLNFYDARAHVRQLAGTERGSYRVLKRNDGNTLQWQHAISLRTNARSEERRVGEAWVSTFRFRWSPYP